MAGSARCLPAFKAGFIIYRHQHVDIFLCRKDTDRRHQPELALHCVQCFDFAGYYRRHIAAK